MMNCNNWEDVFPDIYDQKPVLLAERAMQVFPCQLHSASGTQVFLARLLCNFIGYYFDTLVYIHHPAGKNQEMKDYMVDFAVFLKQEGLQEKIGSWDKNPFFEYGRAEYLIEKLRRIPEPPDLAAPCLKNIYHFIEKIFHLADQPDTYFGRTLYELSVSWFQKQAEPSMQLAPVRNVLKSAEFQIKRSEQKQNSHQYLYYRWGKEYDQYFREFLSSGICGKTAHKKARIKFAEKHRLDTEDSANAYPGFTMNSLRKYRKIYLCWEQDHERM